MRVIILCAGISERLRPETYDTNKNLLEINGKALIEHLLDAFIYSGVEIETVHIIIGHYGYKFRELLGSNYRGLKIRFHNNPLHKITGAAQSLYLASNVLRENECVVMEGDHYLDPELLKKLLTSEYENCILVEEDPFKRDWDEQTVAYGNNGLLKFLQWPPIKIRDVGGPLRGFSKLGEALTIFKLSKQASRDLAAILTLHLLKAGVVKKEIISPINELMKLHDIQYLDTDGAEWVEIDFPADLEKARAMKIA